MSNTLAFVGLHGGRSLENPRTPLANADEWFEDYSGAESSSGVRVSRSSALTYAAVWRAVNLISRDVAKLPLVVYRQLNPGKEPALDHPAYPLLRHKSSSELKAFDLRQTLQAHALLQGNGYAYIVRDGAGRPVELLPLDPQTCYPVRANGVLWYVLELGSVKRKLQVSDVLHIRGLGNDGLAGYSVIEKARESFGLGLGMRKFGARFFANNARPNVVLECPTKLDAKARTELRESWERIHAGLESSHRTAVLDNGLKASQLQINASDAQLIESRQFEIREIANWFSCPPHKLGDTTRTAFASLEQENQAYLDECLDPWLVQWEEECRDKLLTEREKDAYTHSIQFRRRDLVRANLDSRTQYYVQGLSNGWLAPDEVREEEGLNPIPGEAGNQYMRPLNLQVYANQDGLVEEDPPAEMPPAPEDTMPAGDGMDEMDSSRRIDPDLELALAPILRDAVTRMAKRLCLHAGKARRANRLDAWLKTAREEHQEVVEAALAPVGNLLRALGYPPVSEQFWPILEQLRERDPDQVEAETATAVIRYYFPEVHDGQKSV